MKWIVAAAIILNVTACAKSAVSSGSADSAAVMASVEQYRQAWIEGDTAAALRWISDDIKILISGVPDIAGKEAVRKVFVGEMATYRIPELRLAHDDVIVSGDHVIDIGTYEETQVPTTGAPIRGRGRFVTIWRREAGGWRIVRYSLSDLPPARTTTP